MSVKRVSNYSKLTNVARDLAHTEARVGWFPQNWYPEERSDTGGVIRHAMPVAQGAAEAEFGRHARPFIRPAIARREKEWSQAAARLLKTNAPNAALATLAEIAVGDIKIQIQETNAPPLSPRTIETRREKYRNKKKVGSLDKVLIDSGIMFATVSKEIVKT